MSELAAILAIDAKGGIGKNGTIPWPRNSQDLMFFSSKTRGQCVIMGRRTWDDPMMPKPLPDRTNVVITHRPFIMDGVQCYSDIEKAVSWNLLKKDVWIIGGANLIMALKGQYNRILITAFNGDYNCDTFINVEELVTDKYIKRVLVTGQIYTRFEYERVH